jgi:hypothetical protein
MITEYLRDYNFTLMIDDFITLLLIISFLIVIYRYKNEKSLNIGSFVYMFSYIFSNIAYSLLERPDGQLIAPDYFYLQWIVYESLTIILCFMIHLTMKVQHHEGVVNAYRLSCVNMFACLYTHYLAIVNSVSEHWFYSIYTNIVNITPIVIALLFMFNFKWGLKDCFLKFRLS